MFLYSLLEVSEEATDIVKWISVGAVVLLVAIVALIGVLRKKQYTAKRLAFGGVCVATSFTLAVFKIPTIESGGSITFASFVPIMLYAYFYGVGDGLLVGLIHGLLNFIEDPYILTPATFVFDYLLAFASIGVMGLFGKLRRERKQVAPLVWGCIAVYALRFISHFCSGVIFFLNDAVWVEFPAWATANAFIYSFLYQCIYLPADCLIAVLALITLAKTGALDALEKQMKIDKKA